MAIRNRRCRNILKSGNTRNLEDFIKEDQSLDKPKKFGFILKMLYKLNNTRKSNVDIVVDEIANEVKESKSFGVFSNLISIKESFDREHMQKIFEICIELLSSLDTNEYTMPKDTTHHSRRPEDLLYQFNEMLDAKNFQLIYPVIKKDIKKQIMEFEKTKSNSTADDFIENLPEYEDSITSCIEKSVLNSIISACQNCGDDKKSKEEIFNTVDEDFKLYLQYVLSPKNYVIDKLFEVFNNNPDNGNTPKNIIEFYSMILKNIVSTFKDKNRHDAYQKSLPLFGLDCRIEQTIIPNISWSTEEYKEFLELCQKNEYSLPLAFQIINNQKYQSIQQDELFNDFLTQHKRDYILWRMYNQDSRKYWGNKYNCSWSRMTECDLDIYVSIIDELIKRQSDKNIKYLDIVSLGNGLTSYANKVGEYVVKCGYGRIAPNIPNHRRILQPIIRTKVDKAFIEVSDAIEAGGSREMVEKIFYEMLDDGLAWLDTSGRNIGCLKRKNVPRHTIEKKVQTEEGEKYVEDEGTSDEIATHMFGQLEGEPLEAGEYVILDTDHIFDLRDPKIEEKLRQQRRQKYMTNEMIDKIFDKIDEIQGERKKNAKEEDKESESIDPSL